MTTPAPPATPNPLHTVALPAALVPAIPVLAFPRNKDPGSTQWYFLDCTAWLAVVGDQANILSTVNCTVTGGDGALTVVANSPQPAMSGTMAAVQLSAGTVGVAYTLTFVLGTSEDTDSTLDIQVRLTVSNQLTI